MDIDSFIKAVIKEEVRREVSRQLAPIRSLPEKFAGKVTLSIEEMCEIVGVEPTKAGKAFIRNACKNGRLPHQILSDNVIVFPRPMVEAWLYGEWTAKEIIKTEVQITGIKGLADQLR